MALVSYVDILPTIEPQYYGNLTMMSRFVAPHVCMKKVFFSRKSVKGLTQKSLLPEIAARWALLSPTEQTAWSNAGAVRSLNGWRMFVADSCARIKNGFTGNATPSLLHQSWVGRLGVVAPATELKIAQIHPAKYWVSKTIPGTKGKRAPALVTENFALPLTLNLNYKSNLTSVGAGAFAKFYADVWYSYQGQNLIQTLEIPLDLVADWKSATASLYGLETIVIGYTLYFHLYNVQGNLYIDNVQAVHSTQNWVRDTYCEDILQTFTRAFYQIPAHWAPVILPSGADFDSVYEDF